MTAFSAKARRVDAIIATAFIVICLWCANGFHNSNTVTRVGLAHAIAVNQDTKVDDIAPITVDRALFKGHYYCDKAPGTSLLCTPAVFVADHAMNAAGLAPGLVGPNLETTSRFTLDAAACLIIGSIVPSAIMLIAFRRVLLVHGVERSAAAMLTLALAFGTPVFTWSTAVVGHATAAALLFLLFSTAWWPNHVAGARWSAAGTLFGSAIIVEFIAAPAGLAILAFLLARSTSTPQDFVRRGLLIVLGGVPVAVLLLIYNYVSFGSPFQLGYGHVDGWEGMNAGFFGIGIPRLSTLWAITFGSYRGLFILSPAALLGLVAAIKLALRSETRLIGCTVLAVAGSYLLINAGYVYWDGGVSIGPRHLTPMIPFLMLSLAIQFRDSGRMARMVIAVACMAGMLIEVVATTVKFRMPFDGAPMIDHILPAVSTGHAEIMLSKTGLPFVVLLAVPICLVVATAIVAWRLETRRLSI